MPQEIIQTPETKQESIDDLTNGLVERYENSALAPGNVHEIPFTSQYMSRYDCPEKTQFLRTILKVDEGKDFFAVVDVLGVNSNHESLKETFVTHHQQGKSAEVLGFIGKGSGSITVGRSYQEGLDMTTSRTHFSVAQKLDGSLCIADLGSKNGTRVFGPTEKNMSDHENNPTDTKNPVLDNSFWSADYKVL